MSNIHSHPEDSAPDGAADEYLTIVEPARTEIRVQHSRFIACAEPVRDAEAFARVLDGCRRFFHDATHHCYAYRLGPGGAVFRSSDDGEPAGSAGRRILASIERIELSDTAVIVVRYFGGVKLGTGGLAHAYTDAADAVLQLVRRVTRVLTDRYALTFPFDCASQVHRVLEELSASIDSRAYEDAVRYTVSVRRSLAGRFSERLADATRRAAVIQPLPPSSASTT